MSIKEEIADLYMSIDKANAQIRAWTQQLQQKINELQKEGESDG